MPYPMIIPQYSMSPVMMAGGGSAGAQPPMMPVAKALANQGRMTDSTLVHMNPQEVAGLQSLARQNGTSLTINPQTGLPEAFSLENILPAVAGAALTPVLGPMAPLVVGGIGALATGSLEQGLIMGLGAYGGANMAGSLSNLAAPATVAASAPTTAAIAAPGAIGGAAGGTGIMASAAPATTLAQATQLAPAASVGGLGLQASALPTITEATTAATGSSLLPEAASEGVKAVATPSLQVTAPFATTEPISNIIPSKASSSFSPPSGISRLFQSDDNVTYENIGTGLKKAFSSGENAMNFLGDNKMNLAMSAAPMLLTPEQEEADERSRAMIRPYEYQVDNLSGTDVDPFGTESERLRGRFVEKNPYYAAKGGLMSLAEGGEASSTSGEASAGSEASVAPPSGLIYSSPAEARVYNQIAAVQRAAGIPSLNLGNISVMEEVGSKPYISNPYISNPYISNPYITGSIPNTIEKDYGVYRPKVEDSATYRKPNADDAELSPDDAAKAYQDISPREYKRGGGVKSVRKPISRTDPFYEFGLDMSKIAEEQFAGGGMTGYAYDPMTNSYKMAGGGLTSLKAGGLREGAFIVPADVISHLGNGSSEAGMRIVQERLKGRPIKGPGDGMSDSIPTTIGGKQPARVANEEAEIPPEVVAALGNGSMEKGAKKLYEMMDKIRQDRTGKKKQAPAVKADKYMPA